MRSYDPLAVRRLALLALLLAAVAAPTASAQTPPEPVIPHGVTIAGFDVGGKTAAEARDALEKAYAKRLQITYKTQRWSVAPAYLGSYAYLDKAVAEALAAKANAKVPLATHVHTGKIARYAAKLDALFSRPAVNSKLLIRAGKPFLTKPVWGVNVDATATAALITNAFAGLNRGPLRLQVDTFPAKVNRVNFGPIIVIHRGPRRLYLYRNTLLVRRFPIAVGMPGHATPLGRYRVIVKEVDPTWNPPDSPWAEGLGPIPPGVDNPLGTRWIGTSAPAIGIHGTPVPSSVGTAASHGCIRMYMSDVEWLFGRVRVGTPVIILSA
jgi:lipoprotein-anchoring transpeptidase ErfK/SrfK